jgi:hypothetical protein
LTSTTPERTLKAAKPQKFSVVLEIESWIDWNNLEGSAIINLIGDRCLSNQDIRFVRIESSEATEAGKPDFHENRLTKADLRQMLKREVTKRREEAGRLEELRAKVEDWIDAEETENYAKDAYQRVLAEIARLAGTPRKEESAP